MHIPLRESLPGLAKFCLLVTLALLFSGCASLPDRQFISGEEEKELRSRFKDMVVKQQHCHCCLDATAQVYLSSLLFSGQLKGYLQALSPSFVKFVALNPLGQPVGVLTSSGQKFRYVNVMNSTVYDGDVDGNTFADYAPEGFVPAFSYYWLIGRLQPGPVQLIQLSRDSEGDGIWVELLYDNKRKALLLFSPEQGVILRHIVMNGDDERILNILYDKYGAGECPVPGKITITSLRLNSTLEISLTDFRPNVTLKTQDFVNPAPPSFSRIAVD